MRLILHTVTMVLLCLGLMSSASLSLAIAPVRAESALASQAEVEALKQELARVNAVLDSLQKELASLRQLVSPRLAQPTPPADALVTVRLGDHPALGTPEAPLTLIEFSDYQCPYCRRFVETTWPALKRDYIDTGKLRHVFRDFPLDRLHPQARKAAEAARCAGEQGQYWAMHDRLFQHQQTLQVERLKGYARDLGLNTRAFEVCLDQGRYATAVQQDLDAGAAAGVQGTPGFILGKTRSDGTIKGTFIRGAQPLAAFRQAIERLLGEKE
jgi:protein-disulfide isomerase